MKVAIVHHHLGPGGVGRVIAAASRALSRAGVRHVVLTGKSADASDSPALPVHEVPGLEYLDDPGDLTVAMLADRLRAAAVDALGSVPDVWHFHNHSLGKNRLLAEVVARFAKEGERMILQIHDLAEDGRPANYRNISNPRCLYPFSPRICYAFLNSRDLEIFSKAGLPAGCARILANPIDPPPAPPPPPGDPLLFVPVRAIRRKNTGETVFLSALLPEGARIGISRAPKDPVALRIHGRWCAFARNMRLPIGFDVVDRYSPAPGAAAGFESWVSHSTHILSTSVSEGFGLPFLEAAAWGRPLVGRRIPHLAADHARHGIRAGWLYDRLLVPLDWIGANILREHIRTTLERNHRLLGQPPPSDMEDVVFQTIVRDGLLDFGNLPDALQQGIIERLREPAMRRVPVVRSEETDTVAVDWLARALDNRVPMVTVDQLRPYAPDFHQKEIIRMLHDLAAVEHAEPVPFVPPEAVLSAFSAPESFHFLLSAPPPPAVEDFHCRAAVFDLYGTLLIAPAGGVKPDPAADAMLRGIIERHGHTPPDSPSTALHDIIRRHHEAASVPHPEVDLRVIWREMLALEPGTDITPLVMEAEAAWHPAVAMPGAAKFVGSLARAGIPLGILSNAQCDSLTSLGGVADLFAPELCILSYQHGLAKPSPELFQMLTDRLAGRGILPGETLYIGNDPLHDIVPASAHGFKTALFTGHPASLRPGDCQPDIIFTNWNELHRMVRANRA